MSISYPGNQPIDWCTCKLEIFKRKDFNEGNSQFNPRLTMLHSLCMKYYIFVSSFRLKKYFEISNLGDLIVQKYQLNGANI